MVRSAATPRVSNHAAGCLSDFDLNAIGARKSHQLRPGRRIALFLPPKRR
jgi:hypothetical protein